MGDVVVRKSDSKLNQNKRNINVLGQENFICPGGSGADQKNMLVHKERCAFIEIMDAHLV